MSRERQRYQGVLVDAADASLHPQWFVQLCCELAGTDGPILPLIVSREGYALERLMLEQTISVNTAAIGGDTRLLALDDDELDSQIHRAS
jgi:delta 1-pyrroline-5-carboxylate dehydrogenase